MTVSAKRACSDLFTRFTNSLEPLHQSLSLRPVFVYTFIFINGKTLCSQCPLKHDKILSSKTKPSVIRQASGTVIASDTLLTARKTSTRFICLTEDTAQLCLDYILDACKCIIRGKR